ncbi:putative Ig domain-containing protein [Bremerella cremea]|uniref:putative Ig domain-containing protein n=1 Tax=Bremerella cremea TaxID=1031537 RepID=UPI0031EB9DC4
MTQRERSLAILVGICVLSVGGYYFWNQYSSALSTRDRQIDTLRKRLGDEDFTQKKAEMAIDRLAVYRQHALPESIRASQSFYQERLRETLESTGFRDVVIKPLNGRRGGNHYQHMFTISGRAKMEELVQFTYEFYSFNILHKFTKLTMIPVKDSDMLDISMNVSVLSVDGAEEVPKPEDVRIPQLTHGKLKDYSEAIVSRNLFAQANKPPVFTSKGEVEAELERSFRHRFSASDPDRKDQVSFFLTGEAPEGMELSETGSLKWTPSALGEYKIQVEARDNRKPPKSTKQELLVTVVEPAPEPVRDTTPRRPEFDEAKFTYLTGTVAVGGQPKAWLNNRPKNQQLRLGPGDTFTIGSLKGKVVDVKDREVIIEIEGDLKVLTIGQPLADAATMGPASDL